MALLTSNYTKVKIGEINMKLPNMALVFAIIIIPITLIFSLYVGYQIKTVSQQTTYDTRLVSATRDAIAALEINTFGDSTSDSATSTRRNVQASINTFTNSFASNFGVTGYDNSDILTYVPAILVTMYDGYYIYAPTSENTTEDGLNRHILKPYVYYSARYKKDGKYDVVINYSLDNYINITGTVNGKYISESGYLIDTDPDKIEEKDGEIIVKNKKREKITIGKETLYETMSFYLEDKNLDGEINDEDGADAYEVITGREATICQINCKYCYKDNQKYYYCYDVVPNEAYNSYIDDLKSEFIGKWFTYNPTGNLIKVNENSLGLTKVLSEDGSLEDDSAINYYKDAIAFSNRVKEYFPNGIEAQSIIKPDGTAVSGLSDASDVYYIFKDDNTNILNATGDDKALFNQHKLNVMQASITYNLNVAITNYAGTSGIDFRMPEMSETEWNKILTNISMVSFVQGMPIGFKTYNNYAVVTSTNNQMYVSDESIYYVAVDEKDNENGEHHRINCPILEQDSKKFKTIIGYASTEFDKYTVNYQTEYFDTRSNKNSTADHYLSYYRHPSLDCYNCIVNKSSLNEEDLSKDLESAQLHAQARIKYNQFIYSKKLLKHD